jgi:prephenate dehydrogenase
MRSLSSLRIGILGLGQIGGSIAKRLSMMESAPRIAGFDVRSELGLTAKEMHIVTDLAATETELIEACDLVVIALPMREIIAVLTRQRKIISEKVAVTDTGSLKGEVTQLAKELGLRNFVGGHPLAGSEKRGIASWDGALFENANYFLTSTDSTSSKAIDTVAKLVDALGATPVPVDPQQHDAVFATTSNLPHLFAYCLKRLFNETASESTNKELFRCPSFRGAIRVAESDPEMVFQMLWHNRRNLSRSLVALLEELNEAKAALEDGKEKQFRQLFELS